MAFRVRVFTPRLCRGNPSYNATKAAVKSLTESLAYELRETAGSNLTAHLLMYARSMSGIPFACVHVPC